MINTIRVTNPANETLVLELRNPASSGFSVRHIEGLGPSKANVSLTKRAGTDGAIYNSARANHRNIVISLGYFGLDTEQSRIDSFRYFPIKKNVRIEFISDHRDAYIEGYVESNEADVFSEEAGCVISLLCPEAYLFDIEPSINPFGSISPLFEFPFSNESLVAPLLELSEINLDTEKVVYYDGDSPIGFLMHIHAIGSATGVTITDSFTLETISINDTKYSAIVGSGISLGDDIYISTVIGNKFAIAVRGSTTYNILNALGTDPTWFQLEKGDNAYAYTATSGLTNLEFIITNNIAYEGV
jgi:hypothetical protein